MYIKLPSGKKIEYEETILNEDTSYDKAFYKYQADKLNEELDFRKKYSWIIFLLICLYLVFVGVMVVLNGIKCVNFELSNSVLITLLSTTTINIISLLAIIIRYYSPNINRN